MADRRVIGIVCGIVAGISYGMNPLFAKPLMESGVPVLVMLFFRYGISVLLLGGWMLLRKERFAVRGNELGLLALLGVLFSCSSIFLFASYAYIPSGLATTLVYLYPVFVALVMVFLRFYPSWQTWLSIAATFLGILLLSSPSQGADIRLPGVILAILSALSYAFYLV
ncbi:MAG: DMT family transporter, partial [Bacteroidales bacterium]|nr:DMT family transporter [Bacteroidales bacterium]